MVAGTLNLDADHAASTRCRSSCCSRCRFFIFLTALLAELSRQPFDIPIGESEVVGGPLVEYSRHPLVDHVRAHASTSNMWACRILTSLVFLGGWEWPFGTADFWGDYAFLYQLVLIFVKSFILILFIMWVAPASRVCASTS